MFLDKLIPERPYLDVIEGLTDIPSPDRVRARRLKRIARGVERAVLLAALVTQIDTCQHNLLPESVDVVDITIDDQNNLDYQFGSDARDE